MTVVSVLRLPARADVDLAPTLVDLEIFEHSRRSGGFLGGRVLRPLEVGAYLVVAEWDDVKTYHVWLDNPVRAEFGPQLEPLLVGDAPPGELFEEV